MGLHTRLNAGTSKLLGIIVAIVAIGLVGEGNLAAAAVLGFAAVLIFPSLPPGRGHPSGARRGLARVAFLVLVCFGVGLAIPG